MNLIMLLGRWASAAVLGYVEEAMAETTPGFRQQLQLGYDNWEEALPTLSKRVAQLEGKLKSHRETASRNLKELQKKFDTAERARTEQAKERRWLISTNPTNPAKLHREASGGAKDRPAWTWICGCSWRFGLSVNYEFLTPTEAKEWTGRRCDRCDLSG